MSSIPNPIERWIKQFISGSGSSLVATQDIPSTIAGGETSSVTAGTSRTVSGDYEVNGTLEIEQGGTVGVFRGDLTGSGDLRGSGDLVGS